MASVKTDCARVCIEPRVKAKMMKKLGKRGLSPFMHKAAVLAFEKEFNVDLKAQFDD